MLCNPTVEIEIKEIFELQHFSEFVAKKRPHLTEEEKGRLLRFLNRGVLGDEYFINIANSISEKHKKLLPTVVFIRRELISCKCYGKTGNLCGVWPNNQEKCKKQQFLLTTLYATILHAFYSGHEVGVVNGLVVKYPDPDTCGMYRELCKENQDAARLD